MATTNILTVTGQTSKKARRGTVQQAKTKPASAEITALVPGLIYVPPCPPELAKPTLRPPVAR